MKAEEKIVAFMFFSVVMQFVYSLEKNNRIWGWGRGGEGQEQRDRRAKFKWQITGNSSKNNRWGPSIIK